MVNLASRAAFAGAAGCSARREANSPYLSALTPPLAHSASIQDAKKAAKKDVKQALKALHLDREPPAYVDAHDADAFLLACGLPVSKLATLKVNFGERLVSRGDLFSKTKAAHRCVAWRRASWRVVARRARPAVPSQI